MVTMNPEDVRNHQQLKERLANDLKIVTDYEELLARYGIANGRNGATGTVKQSLSAAVAPDAANGNVGLQLSVEKTVRAGAGMRMTEVSNAMTAAGYKYATKASQTAAVSTALRRLLKAGRIRRERGKYHPPIAG